MDITALPVMSPVSYRIARKFDIQPEYYSHCGDIDVALLGKSEVLRHKRLERAVREMDRSGREMPNIGEPDG